MTSIIPSEDRTRTPNEGDILAPQLPKQRARHPTSLPEFKAAIAFILEHTEWSLESRDAARDLLQFVQQMPKELNGEVNRLSVSKSGLPHTSRVSPSAESWESTSSPSASCSRPDIDSLIIWISPAPVKVNGHFCDVFAGTHSGVGKVALKRPRTGAKGYDEDVIRRFQREAATWGKLQHRHILEYLGSFQRDGHFYFVSPFIENGTLAEYIVLHPGVNRIKLLCETADAIAYLHKQDVVHGDIKANNLLIGNNRQVLLCDFGLTRTTDFRTSTAMKGAGTLRWQSPELWNGDSKSFKSDVYAFGMTIAEVLTGDVPFPGLRTDGAVIRAVLIECRRPPRSPVVSPGGLSYEKVWAVAEACWCTDPEARISASEALQLIQEDLSWPQHCVDQVSRLDIISGWLCLLPALFIFYAFPFPFP